MVNTVDKDSWGEVIMTGSYVLTCNGRSLRVVSFYVVYAVTVNRR